MLSKKHNSIAFHRVREAQAATTIRVSHFAGVDNWADMLTKCLDGVKLFRNRGMVLR
jgi:hypothetical protein